MKIVQIKIEGTRGWALLFHGGSGVLVNWQVSVGSPRQGSWLISPGDWQGHGSWAWASKLHRKLEGFAGCSGDLAPYRQALGQFFD